MSRISTEDIKSIISIVGREGAIAAIYSSKKISSECLVGFANSLGLEVNNKDTKNKIATQIVRHVDKRITKTVDELKIMSKEDIVDYFNKVDCDQEEIVELLSSIDFKSRTKSLRAIIEFAAIQISSLGIFERLSHKSD